MAGWPLDEVTDPFVLEVHRPVQPEDARPVLPYCRPMCRATMTRCWPRWCGAAADGRSGIAVLVGGSSTGKTRACWEALALSAGPGPAVAAVASDRPVPPGCGAAGAGGHRAADRGVAERGPVLPRPAEAGLGERVAAGLRELLRDPARAPVLVLATLWPRYWGTLTARPDRGPDPHAQARELLAGHDITVPSAFTSAQLDELGKAEDARLALAAAAARDGQVIQFLAGAPELLARYRNAPPAAAALISAAMDARRLGMGAGLPRAFLEAAVPGIPDRGRMGCPGRGLAGAGPGLHCRPVQGRPRAADPHPPPAAQVPPGPARLPDGGEPPLAGPIGPTGGPVYRLADYLDQHGRQHRKSQIPPAGFWAAAADHVSPADQAALGDAADARGLYRDAAQLHKNAAAAGNLRAASYLSARPPCLHDDVRPVRWAVAYAALDDPGAVATLLRDLRGAGAQDQVTVLASRAAMHVPLNDTIGVARLLESLREAGAQDQAAALLDRDLAACVSLDDPGDVARLLETMREAGAQDQVTALLDRDPAVHVSLIDPSGVARLLARLWVEDARDQITALASRAAAHVPLNDTIGVSSLLLDLWMAGARDQVTALASRAAADVPLDNPAGIDALLRRLRFVGADRQFTKLADHASAHVSLDERAMSTAGVSTEGRR